LNRFTNDSERNMQSFPFLSIFCSSHKSKQQSCTAKSACQLLFSDRGEEKYKYVLFTNSV
jgi:hypothetical protein